MYNRYTRNDDGSYTRIPEEEPARRPSQGRPGGSGPEGQRPPEDPHGQDRDPSREQPRSQSDQGPAESSGQEGQGARAGGPFRGPPPPSGDRSDGLTGFLRHFLDRWHLDSVDTGDLLLLGLLFFLFKEDADEELLTALGLLLIL